MSSVVETKGASFLDRPVFGGIRLNWWTAICIVLIVAAIATRYWDLSTRAYSHDESIHASWSWDLYTGRGYQHNPTYHGPFGYHFTAFMLLVFGDSDAIPRASAATFGILVVILPLFMRKWLGQKGTLAAMALLIISPIIMARSRYIRWDIFIIAFQMVMAVAIFRYLEKRKDIYLYIIAATMSLAFATKETAYIYAAIFGSFLGILLLVRWFKADRSQAGWWKGPEFDLVMLVGTLLIPLSAALWDKLAGLDPVDYSNQNLLPLLVSVLVMIAISAAVGIWWDKKRWPIAAGIFWIIFATFFTTLYTNGKGFATGIMGSLGYWLSQQNVNRGGQPWFYYLILVPMYDFMPLILGIFGIGYGLTKYRKSLPAATAATAEGESRPVPFIPFIIYWFVLSLIAYSMAGEKMPWLALNISVPLMLVAGWYVGHILDTIDWAAFKEHGGWVAVILIPLFITILVVALTTKPFQGTDLDQLSSTTGFFVAAVAAIVVAASLFFLLRRLGKTGTLQAAFIAVFIVLTGLTLRAAFRATFKTGDIPVEMLVYAQGSPDIKAAMDEITQLSQRTAGGLQLKIAYDDESSWPFVWYLRNFPNAQFYGKKPGAPFDAAVVLVGDGNEPGIKPYLGGNYFRREFKFIWWPTESYKDLTLSKIWNGLLDPAERQNVWNIFMYRKYRYGLDNWPHYNKFIMYVRKDVAAQLWNYGPEVVATDIQLPGEEYDKAYQQIPALDFWGQQGSAQGDLNYPKGLAVDAQGDLFVADSQNHRIVEFGPTGSVIMQFGSQGSGPGQFQEPWGVAVDAEGNIYVADTWNHRVQKFDSKGTFITAWGSFGDVGGVAQGGENTLYGPRAIIVGQNGDVYVTDTGNKRVVEYTSDGQYVAQYGGAGLDVGQFMEPVGITQDAQGNFYVADTWNRRIQKFDATFAPIAQWPFVGWEGESVVNKPYLATDAQGNVYVTDPEMYRLVKFDPQGKVLAVWGQLGTDASSLNLPTGIAVDQAGNVYVADSNNHRIVKYGPVK